MESLLSAWPLVVFLLFDALLVLGFSRFFVRKFGRRVLGVLVAIAAALVVNVGVLAALAFVTDGIVCRINRAENTKIALQELSKTLASYKSVCDQFPTTEQGLAALMAKPAQGPSCERWSVPFLKKSPRDGWGSPYVYSSDGAKFTLVSLGRDRREGGTAQDMDLAVTEKK